MTTTPYRTTFAHLHELQQAVGQELGLSQWVTVTQDDINTFARLTGDEQWIHVDEEQSAKYSPYGTTVAHGFFVLSLASKFTYECLQVEDVKMGVNYGLNKVRFPSATPVNAKVRARISLLDYLAIPNGARYTLQVVFELDGQEKPACVAEFVGQVYV
ncbi:MAG: MaoC family dehydratase [Bacteroidota bacterium]